MALMLVLAVQKTPAATGTGGTPDACALIANDDVRRVLGVEVKERQPGTQDARGLLLAQCYLGTGTPRSVSVAVAGATKSRGKTVTPRAFWKQQFGEKEREEKGKGREGEHESEAVAVRGVGDQAFWSGTRVAGALYVLRGNTFIRVSVGGIGDERERIDKSRQLAVAALARLPK